MRARFFARRMANPLIFICTLSLLSSCGEDGGAVSGGDGAASGGRSGVELAAAEQGGTGDRGSQQEFERKIVKEAELGIRAGDVRDAAALAQRVAAEYGGSVSSSRTLRADGVVHAELVLSVPAPAFEAALDDLRGLGEEVTKDGLAGEDVTEEFVDLRSRERNLLAAEGSLSELYDRAKDVEDALSIQRELTDVRGRVEEVQGRIQYLEEINASATISLSIRPVAHAPAPPPAWDPALLVASRAWNASVGVLQGLASAIISVLVFGWWLLPAVVAASVAWRRRMGRPNPNS